MALATTCTFHLLAAQATEKWQIASNTEVIQFGQKITINIVKLDESSTWPTSFKMVLSGNGKSEEVILMPVHAVPAKLTQAKPSEAYLGNTKSIYRAYVGQAVNNYAGIVRAELAEQKSNRIVMLAPREEAGAMQAIETSDSSKPTIAINSSSDSSAAKLVIANPNNEPALSANEPMYFLMGKSSDNGTDARFQLSFKYRPFDPKGSFAEYLPALSNLYFAYTQTTLWDIGAESGPFRDTSYRPSLFYRWVGDGRGLLPNEWRVGAEHESNGQNGESSRSLNAVIVRPTWHFDMADGKRLSFYPKIQYFLNKEDNADIQRYRGYVDWQLRYGREDGLVFGELFRSGTGGYYSNQLDVSYPISDRIFARTGAFVHLQLLTGYGETLLDFDKKTDTQLRIGFSIAR